MLTLIIIISLHFWKTLGLLFSACNVGDEGGFAPNIQNNEEGKITGFQLITESNSNCPLLHIALLQYINHLIWLVSCTFLTSPDNSDHLPHSSFLLPELN